MYGQLRCRKELTVHRLVSRNEEFRAKMINRTFAFSYFVQIVTLKSARVREKNLLGKIVYRFVAHRLRDESNIPYKTKQTKQMGRKGWGEGKKNIVDRLDLFQHLSSLPKHQQVSLHKCHVKSFEEPSNIIKIIAVHVLPECSGTKDQNSKCSYNSLLG